MSRPRIALLNAAHDGEDPRRNFTRELDADVVEFSVTDGELPGHFSFDACCITGSRDSVYWEDQWIQELKSWVSRAVDSEMLFLGVCFGHQLLADVLGGEVEAMGEYEIGYRTVKHDGSAKLFDGVETEFTVFTAHSDRVSRLPPGAEKLAANEYGIHGFRAENVYGVQFHPEYDRTTARNVVMEKANLPAEKEQQVLAGITDEAVDEAAQARTLFENFTELVRRQRPGTDQVAAGVADD